jgi:hypothetical protein
MTVSPFRYQLAAVYILSASRIPTYASMYAIKIDLILKND